MENALTSPDELTTTNPTPGDHAPFTPGLKARFCEALAESGRVTAACRAVGKHRDTIYEHLRTDPLFAAACDASRHHARQRLADRLLEDSIDGSVDHFYRDGELVGERRYTDNRLAFSMLRRLDKLAENDAATERATGRLDPQLALQALRTGSDEDLRAALALLESDTSDNPQFEDEEFDELSDAPLGTERVWLEVDGAWWTDFPPPDDFTGKEEGSWGDDDYSRQCTPDESDLLSAARDAELKEMKDEEEAERTDFFAGLRSEVEGAPHSVPFEAAGGVVQDTLNR